MTVDEMNIGQEVISGENEPEKFQQDGPEAEPTVFQNGKEVAAFFEPTFAMTEQEAQLLVNYTKGHGYILGYKDEGLYRGDLCYEQDRVKWEPDTIDDVVNDVSEWNFEMMQAARADMENPDNMLDFSKKKSDYDSLCEDEKVLDVLFDRTKYGKALNDMAQKLAEEFIRDLTSEKGLEGAIKRMKDEMQQADHKKERSR